MSNTVYVVVGQSHIGYSETVGVYADEESARARCRVANRDPDLYLSSCDVYVWSIGEDSADNTFRVYPSAEDAKVMRDGLEVKRKLCIQDDERRQLAILKARYETIRVSPAG